MRGQRNLRPRISLCPSLASLRRGFSSDTIGKRLKLTAQRIERRFLAAHLHNLARGQLTPRTRESSAYGPNTRFALYGWARLA